MLGVTIEQIGLLLAAVGATAGPSLAAWIGTRRTRADVESARVELSGDHSNVRAMLAELPEAVRQEVRAALAEHVAQHHREDVHQ